jgi:hypothetical protein
MSAGLYARWTDELEAATRAEPEREARRRLRSEREWGEEKACGGYVVGIP